MTAPQRASNLSKPHFTLDPSLDVQHPLLAHLLDYWRRKCGDRAMPSRADIDPLDLREHMGWMILTDVVTPPLRLRFRLIGAEVTRLVGRDSTGKYWDEIYAPEIYDATTAAMRWVVEHGRPLRVLGTLKHAHRAWIDMESLDLPLSSDGETVTMVLTRSIFR